MDGRGGCCIARYAGGAYDMSKVDRIMLKFRPIAPKPASSGSVSGGSSPEKTEVKSARGKRKYVRDGNSKRCYNRKRKPSPEEADNRSVSGADTMVTLPLLPETPDRDRSPASSESKPKKNGPIWLNFEREDNRDDDVAAVGYDRTVVVAPQPVRVVGSIVTVECVTDTTWAGGDLLGRTDEERRWNLRRDTCPGFVSDGLNRVVWANGAYRSMVGQDDHEGEVIVWLVMRDQKAAAAAWSSYASFTCMVRVQYPCGGSATLPCDAWRMDSGGFAWRLDVKAALCLGR